MTQFLYPQMFWFLLLPFLIYWGLSRVDDIYGEAISIPFLSDLKDIKYKAEHSKIVAINHHVAVSLKLFYLFIIWGLLVAAAARPQHVGEPYHLKSENRDIMLVVDISNSMQQPDFSTRTQRIDRMTAVKHVVSQFIGKRTEDRVGLILFGTLAYLQSPLTFDKRAVQEILLNTDAGMAGNSTSIGDALGIALKNLKDEKQKSNKVIILLTDGENNDGSLSMAQAIDLAEKEGIKIYTIGVGGDISFMSSLFSLRGNELDEKSLKALAEKTKGNYFRAKDLASLNEIYKRIDELEPQNDESSVVQEIKELFYIPLLIALGCLFLLLFLPRSFFK
jgi:Ca-activated chloride channel family protein